MKLSFVLSESDFGPFHENFVHQVKRGIATGAIAQGVRFPSVRTLAKQYGKNPNTIAKCVRNLQEEGILTKGSKQGTYVAYLTPSPDLTKCRPLFGLVDQLLVEAACWGANKESIIKLIESRAQLMGLHLA